jgi:hypothetical protein
MSYILFKLTGLSYRLCSGGILDTCGGGGRPAAAQQE